MAPWRTYSYRDQKTTRIEVELTPKAPKRLESIVRAWRRARWVECVRYYVPAGGTRRGVERAIARMRAGERVEVRAIEGLLDSERWPSQPGRARR